MGLQEMGHGWDPAHLVSEVSVFVYRLWDTPQCRDQWDMHTVADGMYRYMDLDSMRDHLCYDIPAAKNTEKMSIAFSIGRAVGFYLAAHVYSFLC